MFIILCARSLQLNSLARLLDDDHEKKLDMLIRAMSAAKDGRKYTMRDDKWHLRYEELKAYKEIVSFYTFIRLVSYR